MTLDHPMRPDGQQPAEIRPATEADVDRLVDLLWAVAAEGRWIGTEIPFDRNARRDGLAERIRGAHSVVLVADAGRSAADAGVVGEITVNVTGYGVADISMLLAEGWRGRGLGAALLDAALDWAGGAGAHKAFLEVWPHNEAGVALYRSRGFVEEGRKLRHYRRNNGECWDAILMGRPLART
jgi:ribosomal protein S18 acetylase RimI-like enzyme